MIKVKVPATSANIGPGFDCCGLALNLYNYYYFELADSFEISGVETKYTGKDNLVYTSFLKVYEYLGKTIPSIHLHIETNIPISRGLGSSAACIIGGVIGANALLSYPLDEQTIFKICTDIEGHPDNIAPALFGGLCASFVHDNMPHMMPYNIDPKIKFCALIPDYEISTKEARAILPKSIDFSDAIYNLSHFSIALKCLETKNLALLKIALDDKLHQPYRKNLISEYDEIDKICSNNYSAGFFISGAGPTLMNIITDLQFISEIKPEIDKLKSNWKIVPLRLEMFGALKLNEGGHHGR